KEAERGAQRAERSALCALPSALRALRSTLHAPPPVFSRRLFRRRQGPLQYLEMAAQQVGHFLRGREPLVHFLGMQLADDVAKPVGHVGVDLANGPGRILAD